MTGCLLSEAMETQTHRLSIHKDRNQSLRLTWIILQDPASKIKPKSGEDYAFMRKKTPASLPEREGMARRKTRKQVQEGILRLPKALGKERQE